MVVYTHHEENGETNLRVRPLKIFQEKVMVDGKEVERFTYIGE